MSLAPWGDGRLPNRFWDKTSPEPNTGCWFWLGATRGGGYGAIKLNGRHEPVHRVAYEALVGPIAENLVADHLCRNRICCNPNHVEPVTQRENVRRGSVGSRTSCVNGHPYTVANTYLTSGGRRGCRVCRKEASRMWKQK